MIMIAMYTGCRIEEICRLYVKSVITKEKIKCLDIDESKTDAGVRITPIHSRLLPEIERMVKDSSDGYLIKSTTKNKYNERSSALSKKFGRMKTEMGYDKTMVFHSIRKTVTTQLENSETPTSWLKSIIGHERGDITYDVYSDGPTLVNKKRFIEKLKYNL